LNWSYHNIDFLIKICFYLYDMMLYKKKYYGKKNVKKNEVR
jgi:hypothetical protein